MDVKITIGSAPSMGDLRGMGEGVTLWLEPRLRESPDWQRYVDAVRQAMDQGADVRWLRK